MGGIDGMTDMERTERIGNVELDLSMYSGQDLYCDGEVEDRILEIARNHAEEEFDSIIREVRDWPTLYHLSSIRGNIVSWIPFRGTEKVLEIGAGPGAITGALASRCAHVDCVELSYKRSLINAYRHRNADNITIHVGNFEDIEPTLDRDYDYIFLIGVLEYAGSYLHDADPFRKELRTVLSHLAENGRLVIAIENRLGMKYWAGCAEDHSGRYFDGIESYVNPNAPARTFSRPALEVLLQESGAREFSFYYPYPDYKFPSVLYSDRKLPKADELNENIRNYDRDRLLLFDEKSAYKGMTEDGLYPLFANSFEVIAGPALPVDYCKFSNDRAPEYQIRTEMDLSNGLVRKYPLNAAARDHVMQMVQSSQLLGNRYGGSQAGNLRLQVAPCLPTEDGGVQFPMVYGRSLENLLDERLAQKDGEGFLNLLSCYRSLVGAGSAYPVSDYDMTFSNILVAGNVWTVIDYEWAVSENLRVEDLLFRSLLVYYLEDENRKKHCEELVEQERLFSVIGVTQEDARRLTLEEQSFQNQVTGGVTSLGELRAQLGREVIKPAQLQTPEELETAQKVQEALREKKEREERSLSSIQIYYDTGKGYREEESCWSKEHYAEEGIASFAVEITENVRRLRVDPAICPCIVLLREGWIVRTKKEKNADNHASDYRLLDRLMRTNGRKYSNKSIVYTTADPCMEWDVKKLRRRAGLSDNEPFCLELTLQMAGLPSTMAQAMAGLQGNRQGAATIC